MTEHDEGSASGEMGAVEERLARIQQQHRGRIRWRITKHTAELAIRALNEPQRERGTWRRSGKSRRRKRRKRLL